MRPLARRFIGDFFACPLVSGATINKIEYYGTTFTAEPLNFATKPYQSANRLHFVWLPLATEYLTQNQPSRDVRKCQCVYRLSGVSDQDVHTFHPLLQDVGDDLPMLDRAFVRSGRPETGKHYRASSRPSTMAGPRFIRSRTGHLRPVSSGRTK